MNIFFDLDGPVLDVSERHYRTYKSFLKSRHMPYLSKTDYWRKKRDKKAISVPKNHLSDFKKYWITKIESPNLQKNDRLQPGIVRILSLLSKKQNLYLVTLRQSRKNLLSQLKRLNLLKYFKRILSKSPILFNSKNNWKIKMKMISVIANSGDIIVGDTGTDILCGQGLQMSTIAVTYGIKNKKQLNKFSPDYLINKPTQLLKIINKLS